MSKPRHALTSLLSRLGVAGPARSRVSPGSGLSKISFSQAGQTRSLVVLCALAGLFALSTATAVAQAEAPKLISYGWHLQL